ncbi:MFS transporter [Maricaulis sp.]|uniref:MFS transporter n=1 Tax=Maricaulis sp. TaxID=1486257 RepID=UPI002610F3FE|nr:MFS transporter [Maricaulis sp.]
MTTLLTDIRYGNIRALIAAISCAGVCGIVFGLSMPLISLRLEFMTGSGLLVGLNGAAAALSTLIMAPLVPRLMTLAPARRILVAALAGAAALFVFFPVWENVTGWFVLRFTVGCLMTVVFVISESWINQVVSPERRAFMLGVYGTALAGGFGIGGLLFAAFDPEGDMGFYVGAAIFLAGILPVTALRGPQAVAPDREGSSLGAMLNAARSAPAAILAGLAFGALETLAFSLLPVYGERIGLAHTMIGMVMVAAALGALTFQIPLGFIADKTDRRATLFWIAAIATFTPLAAGLAGSTAIFLLPLIFIQAGVASGLYSVGLSLLGERFTGGAIAAANAGFIFAYGLGSFAGPPVAGGAMDAIGPWGLLWTLSAISGAYVIVVGLRSLTASAK